MNEHIQSSEQRIRRIRREMQQAKMDAIFVNHLPSIRYLTGFSGSSALLIIKQDALYFLTNDLYEMQIKHEVYQLKGLSTFITRSFIAEIAAQKVFSKVKQLGISEGSMSYSMHKALTSAFPKIKTISDGGIVQKINMQKMPHEVEHIRKAAKIASKVFQSIIKEIKPGIREADISAEIAYQGRKAGAEKEAFDIIVVSGERSAMPHGRATNKKIKKGDAITMDFGFYVNGFASDMTRTVFVGKASDRQKLVYNTVLEAVLTANAAAKAGIDCKKLDGIARNIIEKAGFGEFFRHSLGHGLGIEVHESPRVSREAGGEKVPNGSVITIEPGIYLPGEFGVRIEDDLHIAGKGAEVLTLASKQLLEL
ncbi:MAG: M24 family metallopeptidase [Candidatus Kapaibacteriota bacterium]